MAARNVGILIFDDVEVLDFSGPFEVFSMASAIGPAAADRPFAVFLVAQEERPYRASGGIPGVGYQVSPHFTFRNSPHLDIVIAPGGAGTRVEDENSVLLDWLEAAAASAEVAASVCTGAFLYAARGLLDGQRATTHVRQIQRLRDTYPNIEVVEGARWVDEGHFISSAGVSAGIDMSLQLVARLLGLEIARRTARAMQCTRACGSPGVSRQAGSLEIRRHPANPRLLWVEGVYHTGEVVGRLFSESSPAGSYDTSCEGRRDY